MKTILIRSQKPLLRPYQDGLFIAFACLDFETGLGQLEGLLPGCRPRQRQDRSLPKILKKIFMDRFCGRPDSSVQ